MVQKISPCTEGTVESQSCKFESQLHHLLVMWPWTYFSPCLLKETFWKSQTMLPLIVHWPKLSHITIHKWKGDWKSHLAKWPCAQLKIWVLLLTQILRLNESMGVGVGNVVCSIHLPTALSRYSLSPRIGSWIKLDSKLSPSCQLGRWLMKQGCLSYDERNQILKFKES